MTTTTHESAQARLPNITLLLGQIEAGQENARQELLSLAYEELRRIAGGMMKKERSDHTWQPTELVHEAAIRLLHGSLITHTKDRKHFFGVMVTAMRHVLVDHARAQASLRRGGGRSFCGLDKWLDQIGSGQALDLISLDDALHELESINPRQKDVVVLRFFGGLTVPEVADHLGCSVTTAEKDWRVARAWLRHRLDD